MRLGDTSREEGFVAASGRVRARRVWTVLVVALACAASSDAWIGPAEAHAQEALPLLETVVDPLHFGLVDAGDIARGRVSIVYKPEGAELMVHHVRSDPIPPRVTYAEPPVLPEPLAGADAVARQRALWVWQTRVLLDDASERSRFLDFVRDQEVSRIFLLIPPGRGTTHSAGFVPFSSEELGPLVAELRHRGALTYALDGDPSYALAENHAGVVRTVERVVEHNRVVPEEQRFHGVRYDIEPYLVPGFQGPRRQALLDGYVTVIDRASQVARAGGLAFAVDVPFWLDAPDEETGAYLEGTLEGRRAPLLEHIMASVDDMAIMDYRTSVLGPNGALALAYNEIEMASGFGVEIYVGVETTRLNDEDMHTFFGEPAEGLPPHAQARWVVLTAEDTGLPRLWLVDSAEALSELERRVAGARLVCHWPAGRPTRVAGDLQSFHALGADRLQEVSGEIVRHLASRPAFAGLAFHDYAGYRALLNGG